MKIKEMFGFRGFGTRPEAGAEDFEQKQKKVSEENPANKKTTGLGEIEDKYMKELKECQDYTSGEIAKIEAEFQEQIKTASPEEFARLKEEKDRQQTLLRENLQKIRMNLEGGLIGQWGMNEKKETPAENEED